MLPNVLMIDHLDRQKSNNSASLQCYKSSFEFEGY